MGLRGELTRNKIRDITTSVDKSQETSAIFKLQRNCDLLIIITHNLNLLSEGITSNKLPNARDIITMIINNNQFIHYFSKKNKQQHLMLP